MGFVGRLAASGRRQKTVRGLSGRRYDERMPQRFVTPVEERKDQVQGLPDITLDSPQC
jgi:hypothetical protein